MAQTTGLNHLGLTVRNLDQTTGFFTQILGWTETARDNSYPRSTVTDGNIRLTLWQCKEGALDFDRHQHIGLHHLALTVPSEAALYALSDILSDAPNVEIAFTPEFMGAGPRKHMMFAEPGGLRLELVWNGD